MSTPTPMQANMFHEGNTCPFCQEHITAGQQIVICPDCGAVQHDLCWGHNNNACASYHCDNKVSSSQPGFQPDIMISSSDLDNIKVPPAPKKRKPEEVASQYLPQKPEKLSITAVISLVISILSLSGVAGIFMHEMSFLIIAIIIAVIGGVVGLIALVRINMNRKISGGMTAASSILLSCMVIMVLFIFIYRFTTENIMNHRVNLQLSNLPSEEQLNSLPPAKADALKANAVIKCMNSGIFSTLTFGSGVIIKVDNKRVYILTNKHVVGIVGAKKTKGNKISVTLYNGEVSDGKIEWLAPATIDIAIISCETLTMKLKNIIHVQQTISGPSHPVFAIGNPMNFFWSYTEGVISSIRKQKITSYELEIYQTQTPINQGNSGGGLYGMNGHLIGINTWTLNKSLAEGLNFSISTKSILKLLGEKAKDFMLIEEVKK